MKPEIEDSLGQQTQQEISSFFLENISGITQLIQKNFSLITPNNPQDFEAVIKSIKYENSNKIRELEELLKA